MPNLIEIDAPQALQLPRETAATQGADQAAALGQIGKGAEYMGRALMSYQRSTAKSAATQYRMRMRALQRDVEQNYDLDQREQQFENRLPAIREEVLSEYKFASQAVFDQDARIYEEDYRYSLGENVQTEALQRQYAELQADATAESALIADQEDLEAAGEEFGDWVNRVAVLQSENDITAAQARALTSSALSGAIDNLQDENPELAGQLLERYASHLSPQQYSTFDNSINQARDINASLLAAETVFSENPNASVPQLRTALGELDLTPKQRKEAMGQLRQMATDRETAGVRERARAGRALIQNAQETNWATVPPEEKAARIAGIRRNREASPEAVATALRIATSSAPVVTDQTLFGQLWRNPTLLNTKGFAYTDLADRIKGEDWQKLEKRSAAAADGTLNASVVDSTLSNNFDRYGITKDKDIGMITLQVQARLRGTVPSRDSVQAAFDDVYKAVHHFDQGGLFGMGAGNEYDEVTPGIIAEAEENYPHLVGLIRQRNPDLNADQIAAQIDRSMKELQALSPEERDARLREIEFRMRPAAAEPAEPAAPEPEPERQGVQPRIGTFDPLPADFDDPEDVMLLGGNF